MATPQASNKLLNSSKRMQKSTGSPDKLAEMSVKLDVCVTCAKMLLMMLSNVSGVKSENTGAVLTLGQMNMFYLMGLQITSYFCSFCLPQLPIALNLFKHKTQYDTKLESNENSYTL